MAVLSKGVRLKVFRWWVFRWWVFRLTVDPWTDVRSTAFP